MIKIQSVRVNICTGLEEVVSKVLRKMIDASNGMPPSILQMQMLWEQILTNSNTWMQGLLGDRATLCIHSRTVVENETVQNLMQANLSFSFSAEMSPGLYAIAISGETAAHIAAARLQQDHDSMTEASSLFLKLLCEDPVISLWHRIAGCLDEDLPETDQSPIHNFTLETDNFSSPNRYLKIELRGNLGKQSVVIWMMFEIDYMRRYARKYRRDAETRSDPNGLAAREALRRNIKTTTLALDVVLERLSLTIGECSRLEVGQILPLSEADTGRLSLCAETVNDHIDIGHGEMGRWKQQRALKLHTPIFEDFVREMASLT